MTVSRRVSWCLATVAVAAGCVSSPSTDRNDVPPPAPILIVLTGVTPTPTSTPTLPPAPAVTASPTSPPASSTTSPATTISYIRVAFFGIRCTDGREPPHQSLRQLPVGCKGAVTATPKNSGGHDIPDAIHGPDIEWRLDSGHGNVDVKDHPTEAFNKDVIGLQPGKFSLCATVRGVLGCLDGLVIS